MLMLIDTADPRYGGAPDPDEERRRRWEPISLRILLPVTGSLGCLIVSAVTEPFIALVLNLAAIVLCAVAVRAALPRRRRRPARGEALRAPGPPGEADD